MFGNRVTTTTKPAFGGNKGKQAEALKSKLKEGSAKEEKGESKKKEKKETGEQELSRKMGVKPMKAPPVVRLGKQGFKASRY